MRLGCRVSLATSKKALTAKRRFCSRVVARGSQRQSKAWLSRRTPRTTSGCSCRYSYTAVVPHFWAPITTKLGKGGRLPASFGRSMDRRVWRSSSPASSTCASHVHTPVRQQRLTWDVKDQNAEAVSGARPVAAPGGSFCCTQQLITKQNAAASPVLRAPPPASQPVCVSPTSRGGRSVSSST